MLLTFDTLIIGFIGALVLAALLTGVDKILEINEVCYGYCEKPVVIERECPTVLQKTVKFLNN
jgi:hypothetical protein